jgi:phage N-6-adenine-methyltransferase
VSAQQMTLFSTLPRTRGRPRHDPSRVKTNAEKCREYRQRHKPQRKPKVYHLHESDDWGPPQVEFDKLHAESGFTVDTCGIPSNAKCNRYFTPEQDGLRQDWGREVCFMNPPYSQVARWIAKAYEASRAGATVVCIINASVDTRWWHQYVEGRAEVRFPKGRWKFERPGRTGKNAPRPTAIVIFRPGGL